MNRVLNETAALKQSAQPFRFITFICRLIHLSEMLGNTSTGDFVTET